MNINVNARELFLREKAEKAHALQKEHLRDALYTSVYKLRGSQMFKLGDVISWETPWGTKYLGKVDGLFLDHRGTPCLHAVCIDDYLSDRGFSFIATPETCKLWMGNNTKPRELKVLPPIISGKA